jgi:probable addiction module antidote protein
MQKNHTNNCNLKDNQEVQDYLSSMLLVDDASGFVFAIYNVVRSQNGFEELANKTGITKEGLYKALRPDGAPRFNTIMKIIRALGYDFELKKNIFVERDKKYTLSIRSLADTNPDLVQQWNVQKNGALKPREVDQNSKRVVWWRCPMVDNHEWKESIASRIKGHDCPYCVKQDPKTYRSLANINPELAKEWHSIKNKDLTPNDVMIHSNKKVWWYCSIDKRHEWEAFIANRTKGQGCPICKGKKVVTSNCLATTHPALASQWDVQRNESRTPYDVTAGSNKKAWWKCDLRHEWQAVIASRAKGAGCSVCSNKKNNAVKFVDRH